jgi:hypothetical protein
MKNLQMYKRFSVPTELSGSISDIVDVSMLPKALARAVQEQWQMVPVSAHSRFASLTRSRLAAASCDPADIVGWMLKHPDCNWGVETGRASNLAILEVNHENGQESLCSLCGDRWEIWTDTLKFQDASATSFLFRYPTRRLRFLSSQFEGLRVHAGNLVLLPPSWFAAGSPLGYSDLNASVLGCPEWLLRPEESEGNSAKVIPFPEPRED